MIRITKERLKAEGFTKDILDKKIQEFMIELENHKKTVGVPLPVPVSTLISDIVHAGDYEIVENPEPNEVDDNPPVTREENIQKIADDLLKNIDKDYTENEQKTFFQQAEEAEKYLTGIDDSAPFLTARATSRGITVRELACKVLMKKNIKAFISGKILGYMDILLNNNTIDENNFDLWPSLDPTEHKELSKLLVENTYPRSKDEFKEYCLKNLGKPILTINVENNQVEEKINEALIFYNKYTSELTKKTYYKYKITESDRTNGYVTLPENVIGKVNIFSITDSNEYQYIFDNVQDFSDHELLNIYMDTKQLETVTQVFSEKQPLSFQRSANLLYIDSDWNNLPVGQYIVVECNEIIKPNLYFEIWQESWIQEYVITLIREQWGENLSKFASIQLPGVNVFNGEKMSYEARKTKTKLEEDLIAINAGSSVQNT